MANDSDNVIIAAGGSVWVAPVGSTLPVNATSALDAAFVDVGYISDDGVNMNPTQEVFNLPAWQSYFPIRRQVTARDLTLAFVMLEWKRSNLVLAFGGGSTGVVSTVVTYTPPTPGSAPAEKAVVLEWNDGTAQFRFVAPRMLATDLATIAFKRTDAARLPVTLGIIDEDGDGGFLIYGEDAEFAA